jgi:hypothetical protein
MATGTVERSGSRQIFRWNIDANVGPRQKNNLDDVELVRFGYACMNSDPTARVTPNLRTALINCITFGPFGDDLAAVIKQHQIQRGGTQDGIVSVGKFSSTHREVYDTQHAWIIYVLGNFMMNVTGEKFPRIDLHPLSGPILSARVREIFTI